MLHAQVAQSLYGHIAVYGDCSSRVDYRCGVAGRGDLADENVVLAVMERKRAREPFRIEKEAAAVADVVAGASVRVAGHRGREPYGLRLEFIEAVHRSFDTGKARRAERYLLTARERFGHEAEPRVGGDVGERCGNYYIGIAGCFDSQRDAEFRTAEVVGLEGNESYVEVMIGVGEEIHHIGNVAARTVVDHYYLEVAGIVLLKHGRKHRGKLAGTVLRVNDDRNARPRLRFGFRHLAGTGLRRASDFGQTAAVCGQEPQNGQQSRRERDPHYRHDPVYREI